MLVQFGISLLIFFFMISAAISLPGAARLGINPAAPVVGRVSDLTEDVRHYMTILTGINLLVGLGNTILLLILGVNYALLGVCWHGSWTTSLYRILDRPDPPVLLAWAELSIGPALIVFFGYVIINGGVQNFVQPKIMGQGLRISPVVVFVSLFLWGFLLGGIGGLLAVPLTLLVLEIMDNFDATRPLTILMRYTGDREKPEHKEAMAQMRGMRDRLRGSFTREDPSKPS